MNPSYKAGLLDVSPAVNSLLEGLVSIHPVLFYLCFILLVSQAVATNPLVCAFHRILTTQVLIITMLALYTGGVWSLFSFVWNFFWVFDAIEFFPPIFILCSVWRLHHRYTSVQLFGVASSLLIALWLLLNIRVGLVNTRHSFFTDNLVALKQRCFVFVLTCWVLLTPQVYSCRLNLVNPKLFFFIAVVFVSSGAIIAATLVYLICVMIITYVVLVFTYTSFFAVQFSVFLFHLTGFMFFCSFFIKSSNWNSLITSTFQETASYSVYIYSLYYLKYNDILFSNWAQIVVSQAKLLTRVKLFFFELLEVYSLSTYNSHHLLEFFFDVPFLIVSYSAFVITFSL